MTKVFTKVITAILVTLVVVSVITFGSCGDDTVSGSGEVYHASESVEKTNAFNENRVGMEEIGSAGGFTYFKDVSTDVMYLWRQEWDTAGAGYGGLTVMMNPETGKPLTYTDWVNFEEGVYNGTNENTESGY